MKKFLSRALAVLGVAAFLVLGTNALAAAAAPLIAERMFVVGADSFTIEIPVVPFAVTTIIGFLAPYVVSPLNAILPFITKAWQRAVLSVVVSVILGAGGLAAYYALSGDLLPSTPPQWVGFGFLVIVVCQASYNLVTKQLGAKQIEAAVEKAVA